jgi:hypothetical protein
MPALITPNKAVTVSIIAVLLEVPSARRRNGNQARTVKENPVSVSIERASEDFWQLATHMAGIGVN